MSWTGGKDCSLACYKALQTHDVALLVHFDWETPSPSHPQAIAKLQAKAVKTKFLWLPVKPPYIESYRQAIIQLKKEYGIEGIVTGDITVDTFHGAWIDDVCKGTGVQVVKPLWEQDRKILLEELLSSGIKAMYTCVKEPWMTEDWLGRIINANAVKEMQVLHDKNGLDICGEFGEYHTMTLDAPFYTKTIEVTKFAKKKIGTSFILEPIEISLKPK